MINSYPAHQKGDMVVDEQEVIDPDFITIQVTFNDNYGKAVSRDFVLRGRRMPENWMEIVELMVHKQLLENRNI